MRKKLLLFAGLMFATSLLLKAQVSTYTFASSSGTYTEISGGRVLGSSTSDDEVFNNDTIGDDAPITNTGFPIGFNFTYNGNIYDKFAVNNNGWIILGTGSFPIESSTDDVIDATGPDGYVSAISAFCLDLQGQAGSKLSYSTIGVAPNRTLVVQWKGYREYNSTGQLFNFQIRLNETSNSVNVVYGPFTNNASYVVEVGLRGNTNADFNNRTTLSSWSATTAGTANTDSCVFSTSIFPPTGLTFTWSIPVPCTGTPTPGNTLSTTTLPCVGEDIILSLQNNTSGTGVTYQWQTSPDGISWTNAGTSDPVFITTQTDTTFYQCIVTCSGNNGTSTPIRVNMNPLCYCTSNATSSSYENIDGVVATGGINNMVSGATSYSDFTSMISTVAQNSVMTVTISTTGSWYAADSSFVFIDYNIDGDFADAGELVGKAGGSTSPHVIAFTIPPTSTTGTTRMRIKFGDTGSSPIMDNSPCQTAYSYGEVEDYGVTITAPATCPAPTAFTATANADSAVLTWTSTASLWQIEIGAPGFAHGSGTRTVVASNPYTIHSLADGCYDIYVRDICTPGDTSSWAGPAQICICSGTTSLPYSQYFDSPSFPPLCWDRIITDVSDPTVTWQWNATNNDAQVKYDAVNNQDEWLITPRFDLSTATNPMMKFSWNASKYWMVYPNDNYDMNIYARINGGSWTNIWNENMSDTATMVNFVWRDDSISLVAYSGEADVQFAFQYIGLDGASLDLDSVILYNSTTLVTDAKVTQSNLDECDTIGLFAPPISIVNIGNTVIASGETFNCSYRVNGSSWVTESFNLSSALNPLDTATFVFSTPYLFNSFATYNCSLVLSYTADQDISNDSANFTVTFHGYPVVNLGTDTTVCENTTITLNAGHPGASFDWWNGTSTQSATFDTADMPGVTNAIYWVDVNAFGCVSRDSITVTWNECLGVETNEEINFSILPNPSTGVFNLDFGGLTGKTSIVISDLMGKVAIAETIDLNGTERIQYDLSTFSKGIYNIKIVNGNNVSVRKIVKE